MTTIENEEENYDYDELEELYQVQRAIEKDIKILWKEVIAKYVEFCDQSQVLGNLSPLHDYHKFYEYMIQNNEKYKYILSRIRELEHM
jgi:hypothetical protein